MVFISKNEGFVCWKCGIDISPALSGCRNHCTQCFSSLHVDKDPGDRSNPCKGEMVLLSAQMDAKKGWILEHECKRCHHVQKNKVSDDDNLDELATLIARLSELKMRGEKLF